MNKKFMLFVLPALMALSSCAGLGHDAQPEEVFFKEQVDACTEVFGDGQEVYEVKQKAPLRSAAEDMEQPRIGVQYRKYEEVLDSGEWFVAVRFVAEIKTLNVNATWTRNIYKNDGTELTTEASYATTKAYTSLISNGEDIEPSSGYNYFVVYTLAGIPFNSFNDYYVVAYATLSDNAATPALSPVSSKAMAARIGGNVTFTFDKDRTGYFMAGSFGDVAINAAIKGDNTAAFTTTFGYDGYFVIAQKGADTFEVTNPVLGTEDNTTKYFQVVDGNVRAKIGAKYNVFLAGNGKIYASPTADTGSFIRPIYVGLVDVKSWWPVGAWTAVYAINNSTKTYRWVEVEDAGTNMLVTKEAIDPSIYNQICIVRLNNSYDTPAWNSPSEGDHVYNQTVDTDVPTDGFNDCCYIHDDKTDEKSNVGWGSR